MTRETAASRGSDDSRRAALPRPGLPSGAIPSSGAPGHRQRRRIRDLLASATGGRLLLCESERDLPDPLPAIGDPITLVEESLRILRRNVAAASREIGISPSRQFDLQIASGEASMNCVVHGGGGTASVHADPRIGLVQVRIRDHGKGIPDSDIPRATLEAGWSGSGSFGHGFSLMLRTVDRIYLLTGPEGTTVILEQGLAASQPSCQHEKNHSSASPREEK